VQQHVIAVQTKIESAPIAALTATSTLRLAFSTLFIGSDLFERASGVERLRFAGSPLFVVY
jgi:hypothetical protein